MGDASSILGDIYEAVLDPSGMDKLALVLARAFGTESGFISINRLQGREHLPAIVGLPSATQNFDQWARTAYAEYYSQRNVWLTRAKRRGYPAVLLSQELVDPRVLVRSEWYDYCQKLGAFHCIGAQFLLDEDTIGTFGAHRPRRATEFGEADRLMLQQLRPHLQRAMQMLIKLGTLGMTRSIGMNILDGLSIGVIVVGADSRVVYMNLIADRLIKAQRGLTVSNGILQPTLSKEVPRFQRLVAGAARTSSGAQGNAGGIMRLMSLQPAPGLRVLISPIRSLQLGFGPGMSVAAVIVSDPVSDARVNIRPFAEAHHLTSSESKLVRALIGGATVRDYAMTVGTSVATARTHLKHVMEKTGFHRQTDLVRALVADPLLKLVR